MNRQSGLLLNKFGSVNFAKKYNKNEKEEKSRLFGMIDIKT